MKDRVSGAKVWRRGAASACAAVALGLWIQGCVTTVPAKPPPPPVTVGPEDCKVAERVERLLADLVPTAAVAYGRIDPLLYQVDDQGKIQIARGAVVKDKAAAETTSDLLDFVNEDERAQKTFRNNIEQSKKACEIAQCSNATAHEVRKGERVPTFTDPKRGTVTYSIAGAATSDADKKAFLALLALPQDPQCKRATEAHFEGENLLLSSNNLPDPCDIPDCHSSGDDDGSHLGNECCSRNRPEGFWRMHPTRPRHCCLKK